MSTVLQVLDVAVYLIFIVTLFVVMYRLSSIEAEQRRLFKRQVETIEIVGQMKALVTAQMDPQTVERLQVLFNGLNDIHDQLAGDMVKVEKMARSRRFRKKYRPSIDPSDEMSGPKGPEDDPHWGKL